MILSVVLNGIVKMYMMPMSVAVHIKVRFGYYVI